MYISIKNTLKKLLPQKLLFSLEPKLRSVHHSLLFKGDKYYCPICHKSSKKLIKAHQQHFCPACGSYDRIRILSHLIDEAIPSETHVLDFSPARPWFRYMNQIPWKKYEPTDLSDNFIAVYQYDITDLPHDANTVDLILCFHILEHVENDIKAMESMFQTLKPGGIAWIQTPFKEGNIYEDYSIKSPEERLIHFGQDDHVRIYSIQGLSDRLKSVGFDVEVLVFDENSKKDIYAVQRVIKAVKPI